MRISCRGLVFFAVILLFIMAIPASAAHGGHSGHASSSGPGTSGGPAHAAVSTAQEGGGFPSSGNPSSGQGEDVVRSNAGQETRKTSSPPGWEETGSGQRGGPQGNGGAGEAPSTAGQGGQGVARAKMGAGAAVSPSGKEAIPPTGGGPHQGPPSRSQPYGPGSQPGRYPCGPAQTAEPLPAASGTSDSTSPGKAFPRKRKAGEDEGSAPDESPTGGDDPLTPFLFLPLLGYRRISRKNVLENDARGRVYQAIVRHPGIDALTLAEMVEVNINTLRYHLFTLLRTGKITAFSRPGVVRYYDNQEMYSPFEQCLLHYLRTDTPREILSLLRHSPGMIRQQLADELALSGPSITRHMQNLIEDGMVENHALGRSHHYYLTTGTIQALEKFGSAACRPLLSAGQLAAPQPAG